MKDSQSHLSIKDVYQLSIRKGGTTCRASWRHLTSCQVSLPPRSDLMIRVYGGSGTAQVLFQSIVVRPTNIVGQTGPIPWNPSTQLPTMVSIVLAVGQTEYTLERFQARKSFVLEWCVCRRPTRSRGLLPRNRVQISGANRICGTTFATERRILGLVDSFAFAIRITTKICARLGPVMARLLQSISRLPAIVSPVTWLGRCFGKTRDY
jgi:hypothetical protein